MMTNVATGSFTVSLQPMTFENADPGSRLGRMSIDKEMSGHLVASMKWQMPSAMAHTQGSAGDVAIESVVGMFVATGVAFTFVVAVGPNLVGALVHLRR